MFCTNCGVQLRVSDKFCHDCGSKVLLVPNNESLVPVTVGDGVSVTRNEGTADLEESTDDESVLQVHTSATFSGNSVIDKNTLNSTSSSCAPEFTVHEMLPMGGCRKKRTEAQKFFSKVINYSANQARIWKKAPLLCDIGSKKRELFFECLLQHIPTLSGYQEAVWKRLGLHLQNRRKYLLDKEKGKRVRSSAGGSKMSSPSISPPPHQTRVKAPFPSQVARSPFSDLFPARQEAHNNSQSTVETATLSPPRHDSQSAVETVTLSPPRPDSQSADETVTLSPPRHDSQSAIETVTLSPPRHDSQSDPPCFSPAQESMSDDPVSLAPAYLPSVSDKKKVPSVVLMDWGGGKLYLGALAPKSDFIVNGAKPLVSLKLIKEGELFFHDESCVKKHKAFCLNKNDVEQSPNLMFLVTKYPITVAKCSEDGKTIILLNKLMFTKLTNESIAKYTL